MNESIDSKNSENIKKMFINSTHTLKTLLQVPYRSRTPSLCLEIANIAGSIKFLSAYKDKPDFLELCRSLYLKTYYEKQPIFKQGDFGDAFYVIIHGSVKVYIDEPTGYKNFLQLKEIAQLGKGDAFGEISLLYNSKRTATVIAMEQSDLLVLEKEAFQEYIKLDSEGISEMKTVHLNKLLVFLEDIPIFYNFNRDLLVQLCTKCVIHNYLTQTILQQQNAKPTQMYIIKNGIVKVYKKIKLKQQEITYEIDELSNGGIIADIGLFDETTSDCSYVTASHCEIIQISSYYLKKILTQDILEQFKKSLKSYPDDQELNIFYKENNIWNNYKKQVLKEVFSEKQIKKGFDRRLRLPELKLKNLQAPLNIMDIKASDTTFYFRQLDKILTPRSPLSSGRRFLK